MKSNKIFITIFCVLMVIGIAYSMFRLDVWIRYKFSYKSKIEEQIQPLKKRIDNLEKRVQTLENDLKTNK